ncbi:MAG TPA: transcription antitermination factor NusB [Actinomycetota bacterium]|nr:transcription antitermination factor NusB [Actinomycetota bacterium]
MKPRRVARRLALDLLYEAEIRNLLPGEALERRGDDEWVIRADSDAPEEDLDVPADAIEYAQVLISGVQEHQAELDELIVRYADRWAIDRMPVIDRSLVRMALFELLHSDDVPIAVVINEAVELAKELSTDDSGRFVNGLLGRIAERETAR